MEISPEGILVLMRCTWVQGAKTPRSLVTQEVGTLDEPNWQEVLATLTGEC